MITKKVTFNGYTLDIAVKPELTSVTFTDKDNAVVGQYDFKGYADFNEAYATKQLLRDLVGYEPRHFHTFKDLTGLKIKDNAFDIDEAVNISVKHFAGAYSNVNGLTGNDKISYLLRMLGEHGPIELVARIISYAQKTELANEIGAPSAAEVNLNKTHAIVLCEYDNEDISLEKFFLEVLRDNNAFGYNISNYEELMEHDMRELAEAFDSAEDGSILLIDQFNIKEYSVLHVAVQALYGCKELRYYPGRCKSGEVHFKCFEHAALYEMCPRHSQAMNVLYDEGLVIKQ